MAFVASCFQVIEIESQVRSFVDRYVMVGMKMPVTMSERPPQFFQHMLRGRKAKSNLAPDTDQLWLPVTIDAPPAVPDEAPNTEFSVMYIVSPLGA
jgi:hypothetical protein